MPKRKRPSVSGPASNTRKKQRLKVSSRGQSSRNEPEQSLSDQHHLPRERWTFRVRDVPKDWDTRKLQEFIEERAGTAGTIVHSLALEVHGRSCTATVTFDKIPAQLQGLKAGERRSIPLPNASTELSHLSIDNAFHGFTTLFAPPSEDHKVDIIAISGLGGHAFGSFKERGGEHMWLRDSLPKHLARDVDTKPISRVMVYGYESSLSGSKSFKNLEDLGSDLHNNLLTLQTSGRFRPIVFIAHSLGGLIVKQTLISLYHSKREDDRKLIQAVYGIAFFAVPHNGMDISSLIPMVSDQPNRFLLDSISNINSQVLSIQQRQFPEALGREGESEIVYFYETLLSPTAKKIKGEWVMAGPPAVLVTKSSATCCRPRESGPEDLCPIERSHSDIVKFGPGDDEYDKVLTRIKGLVAHAIQAKSPILSYDEQECLKSLDFPSMETRAHDIEYAATGTCDWLLRHGTYITWAESNGGLLWIEGKPGSGKSTLLKFALSKQEEIHGRQRDALILSFFFHGRGDGLQKTPLGCYRSLLHQILRQIPAALSPLMQEFKRKREQRKSSWEWHEGELRAFFKTSLPTILKTHSTWLFIDALDEGGEENAVNLFEELKCLAHELPSPAFKFHIFITCRHYPILDPDYRPRICAENENADDISRYVRSQISGIPKLAMSSIPDAITEKASGIFMWARLVVRITLGLNRRGEKLEEIAKRINDVPQDLDEIYLSLVREMANKKSSLKLIQWICFSTRPLELNEMRWAMAIEPDGSQRTLQDCERSSNYIPEDAGLERQVQTLSCGLAEILRSSNAPIIQFIHQSVNDFFIRKGLSALNGNLLSSETAIAMAHHQLSRICIRYILIEEISHSIDSVLEGPYCHHEEFEDRNRRRNTLTKIASDHPMIYYAINSWITHTYRGDIEGFPQDDLLELFEWPARIYIRQWANYEESVGIFGLGNTIRHRGLLHVACARGFKGLVGTILQHSVQCRVDAIDEDCRTPLSYAAEAGCEAVVKLLLSIEKVDPDTKDKFLRTPLSYAAGAGYRTVVEILLATGRVDPDTKDNKGRTPLSYTTGAGYKTVVEILLATGRVDPDIKDNKGRTPLSYAAGAGYKTMVKILLATGRVDPNTKDNKGRTPLSYAAGAGYKTVVEILLVTGRVDPDTKDNKGRTPLSYTAGAGYKTVVEILLATGQVDPDIKDNKGRTPLLYAAEEGYKAVVELLLSIEKVDPDAKDTFLQTPLSHAAEWGHETVIKLLLTTGRVDPDTKDNEGRTPLSYAAEEGHKAVVELLLSIEKVDPDAKDTFLQTPLSHAAKWGYKAVVKLLLSTEKVDPDTKDTFLQTPLSYAARRGHEAVVKLLLSIEKVDPDTKDIFLRTPLSYAVNEGDVAVVKLLLSTGRVDPNVMDSLPEHEDMRPEHETIIQLLQSHASHNVT